MRKLIHTRVITVTVFSMLTGTGFAAVPLAYELTVIDPPAGFANFTVVAINNSGEVAGHATNGVGQTGYIYRNGAYEEITGNNGNGISVHDINDNGTVIASLWLTPNSPSGALGGFKRSGDNDFTVLTSPLGAPIRVTAINSSGQISGLDSTNYRALFYDNSTVKVVGSGNTAWAINDLGQIPIGESFPQPANQCLVELYDSGQVSGTEQVVTLPNPLTATNSATCIVRDLNNLGQMVISWGGQATYYYDHSTGVFTLIDILGTDQYAINEAGAVVGRNSSGAVVYDDGQIIELNSMLILGGDGLYLEKAFDINEAGQIIGRARAIDPIQFNIPVLLTPTNAPPILDAVGPKTVIEGDTLEFQLSAFDPEGDTLQFFGVNLSAPDDDDSLLAIGATLDRDTGTFSWTPSFDQAGNYEIQFSVIDNGLPSRLDMDVSIITVGNVNRPPEIAPIAPLDVVAGIPLTVMIVVSDPDGDLVNVSANNLPAGAALSNDGSTLQWTPADEQLGTHIIDIIATDNGTPQLQTNSAISITVGGAVTPQEFIDLLVDQISALGDLPQNLDGRLVQRLQLAKKHLARGKVDKAINEIDKYIDLLAAAIASGDIPSEEGNTLLDLAQQLRALLEAN